MFTRMKQNLRVQKVGEEHFNDGIQSCFYSILWTEIGRNDHKTSAVHVIWSNFKLVYRKNNCKIAHIYKS
jgi:hypothetical protein